MDAGSSITTSVLVARFRDWMAEAEKGEPSDPNAMSLATVAADGRLGLRMVLLKDVDDRGFTFYTNTESRKGDDLHDNPRAALLFHWKSLRRQVRVEGAVERVTDAEADAYFASRPRLSQIGAWASIQSRPMEGRFELEKRVAEFTAKFHVGKVPRPPHWTGYRVVPDRVEFWVEMPFRLHDRVAYHLEGPLDGGTWVPERLYP
ncbi:MAG: pyridoxamine 5'-phosphate oxidase [Rhodobacterales bacterium]|nr:pyridoxamine 5'-phosphate oxidase [Rhodobacterales bacterium]